MTYYVKSRHLPTDVDYKEIGLMSGVEVHQQLLTAKKMFCHCPSRKYTDIYHTKVLRHMRPTMSEMGGYDGTALMEFKKKKEILYLVNKENTCTYELDDTPPFLVNEEALDISIELSLMLGCAIVDELHITRKQYLDGSIPTGFQRTGIVGVGGSIPVNGKRIRMMQVSFEEDSCREVSDEGHRITFRPDRLGMPLIEAVTMPDMNHPVEVAQAVETIGRLFRVSGKVRRGYGSVRQDVNVSVRGGTRIEIKGVPRIPFIPMLVHNEAVRQYQLLEIMRELTGRGLNYDNVPNSDEEVTDLFSGIEHPVIGGAIRRGDQVRAVVVRGVAGIAEYQTQPDRCFQDEIKGRLRVVACLDDKPHCYSTIDFAESGFPQQLVDDLHRRMGATDKDTVFIVWGNDRDAKLGCSEIVLRFREATKGVPSETRQHFPDGHTDFERILPGPERMYPDTDHPPVQIPRQRIADIRANLKSLPWEREEKLAALGLDDDICYHLTISNRYELFMKVVNILGVNPKLAGEILDRRMRHLHREGYGVGSLTNDKLYEIFKMYADGELVREGIEKAIAAASEEPASDPVEVVAQAELEPVSNDRAKKVLENALEDASERSFEHDDQRERFVMGRAMHFLRGRFPGRELYEMYTSQAAKTA